MMTEEKKTSLLPHNCILEDRRTLSVSGVNDVDSFDEQTIVAATDLGELQVEGNIAALSYTDIAPKNSGFFSRVFR